MGVIKNYLKKGICSGVVLLSLFPNLLGKELLEGNLSLQNNDCPHVQEISTPQKNNITNSSLISLLEETKSETEFKVSEFEGFDFEGQAFKVNSLLESILLDIPNDDFIFENIRRYLDERNVSLSGFEKAIVLKEFDDLLYKNYNYENPYKPLTKDDYEQILKNAQLWFFDRNNRYLGVCRDYANVTGNFAIKVLDMNALSIASNNHSMTIVKDKKDDVLYIISAGELISGYGLKDLRSKRGIDLALGFYNYRPCIYSTLQDPIKDKPLYYDINNLAGFLQDAYNFNFEDRFKEFIKKGKISLGDCLKIGNQMVRVDLFNSDISKYKDLIKSLGGFNISSVTEFNRKIKENIVFTNNLFVNLGFSLMEIDIRDSGLPYSMPQIFRGYLNPCFENHTKISFEGEIGDISLGNMIQIFSSEHLINYNINHDHIFFEEFKIANPKHYEPFVMGLTFPYVIFQGKDTNFLLGTKIYPANGCSDYFKGYFVPIIEMGYNNNELGLSLSGEFQGGSTLLKAGAQINFNNGWILGIQGEYEHYKRILSDMNFQDIFGLGIDLETKGGHYTLRYISDDGGEKEVSFGFSSQF